MPTLPTTQAQPSMVEQVRDLLGPSADGSVLLGVSVGPGNPTPEQVAAEIRKVEAALANPLRDIAARLSGEAMLLEDAARCLEKNTTAFRTATDALALRSHRRLATQLRGMAAECEGLAPLIEETAVVGD